MFASEQYFDILLEELMKNCPCILIDSRNSNSFEWNASKIQSLSTGNFCLKSTVAGPKMGPKRPFWVLKTAIYAQNW